MRASFPAHHTTYDFITLITLGVSENYEVSCYVSFHILLLFLSLLGKNILLGILYSGTFHRCFSFSVRSQVSCRYTSLIVAGGGGGDSKIRKTKTKTLSIYMSQLWRYVGLHKTKSN
jgi:hypothetical protein